MLDDGTEYGGVFVAWRKEILRLGEYPLARFDPNRIIDVRNDPIPEDTPLAQRKRWHDEMGFPLWSMLNGLLMTWPSQPL
jgi:hypothetical protein